MVFGAHLKMAFQNSFAYAAAYSSSEAAHLASSLSDIPFIIFPLFQFAFGHTAESTFTVLPIPLPPEVAKGITVLPEKSQL